MKTIKKLTAKMSGVLAMAVLASMLALPCTAFAFDSVTSGDNTTVTLNAGENVFTIMVSFENIETAFASAQFDITVDDINGVKATGISFTNDISSNITGVINNISSGGKANGNRVTYKAGFFSDDENHFTGNLNVGTITFSCTSNSPQTITLNGLKIFSFTGSDAGQHGTIMTEVPWNKTITVSRMAQVPQVAVPTANPQPGGYDSAKLVTLSCATSGVNIYYTTDGSTPTRSSRLYSGAITVDRSMTINAIATKDGYTDSPVAAFNYTITIVAPVVTTVASPTASPAPGEFSAPVQVTLSCATTGAGIYYTTDGTSPTRSGKVYSGPVTVNTSTIIKAFAVKEGYADSTVATFAYTVNKGSHGNQGNQGGSGVPGGSGITGIPDENTPSGAPKEFKDVGPEYAWAKDAIEALAARNVIYGDDHGNYNPGSNITRADFVVMLSRLADLGETGDVKFSDVPDGQYYTEAISKAAKAGIISGTGNGAFSPKKYITRQDAFTIIYRLLDRLGKTDGTKDSLDAFSDGKDVAGYASQAVPFLVAKGLVAGSGGKLSPLKNITRAEAAVVLYKLSVAFDL